VANGSGVSRGDRNRNARLARLRELVPVSNAVITTDQTWDPRHRYPRQPSTTRSSRL
jgi:hypothetical protein